jgi:glycine betaine/choline ABC-type transport system substrate-binding protein
MKLGTMRRAACLALAAALTACTSPSGNASPATAGPGGRPGRVISVGSFDFPESVLLAQIYGQALAAARFPVRILRNLGPREVVDPALMDGLLQVVPEYAGSALEFFSLGRRSATANAGAANRGAGGGGGGWRPGGGAPGSRAGRQRASGHRCDRRPLRAAVDR